MRLTVLGGSSVATPQLIDAIATWPAAAERRPELDIVLHGRSLERLRAIAAVCAARLTDLGVAGRCSAAADRQEALNGADVVLNQVRVGGLAARSFDESFPHAAGVAGEETMGPGGLANALRTLPVLRELWRDVLERAPGALVVNLTNPAGIVQQAAEVDSGLTVMSVCDSPITLTDAVAERLGVTASSVRTRYVGMNHLGWYVPDDPGALRKLDGIPSGIQPLVAALHEAVPSAYVRYYVDPEPLLRAQLAGPTRAQRLLEVERESLDAIARKEVPDASRRPAVWYKQAVVPLIDAWLNGSDEVLIAGARNGARVPGVSHTAVVEGPVVFPAPRTPWLLELAALPPLPAALLAQHATYEGLAVRAALDGDDRSCLRALLANPMVCTVEVAEALNASIRTGP